MRYGTIVLSALTVAFLGAASPGRAQEVDTIAEIDATHEALQKATENLGCLVTLSGSREPELVKILDMLNDSETKLREARRLAQNASSAEDRTLALQYARSSRAIVDLADDYREQSGIN